MCFSFIDVFDKKNTKYFIQYNVYIFINWYSLCSTIIKHGSYIHACVSYHTSKLEKNCDTINRIK